MNRFSLIFVNGKQTYASDMRSEAYEIYRNNLIEKQNYLQTIRDGLRMSF